MAEPHTDLRFSLPIEPVAPATARLRLRATDQLADGMRPDLELLVSELVSNVVRHSGLGPEETMEVYVRIEPRHVRVEVRDAGGKLPDPLPQPLPEGGPGGYGLYLVERIASRWGASVGPDTTVWFELEEE